MTNYSTKISDNSKDIFNENVLSPLFGDVVGGKLTSQPNTRHYVSATINDKITNLIESTKGGQKYTFSIPANQYIKPSHIRVMYHVENSTGNTYTQEGDVDKKAEFGAIQIRNCNSTVFDIVDLSYDKNKGKAITIEKPYLQELMYNMKQAGSPDDELSTSFVKHESVVDGDNTVIDKDNKFIRDTAGATTFVPRKPGYSSFKQRELLCRQTDKSNENLGVMNVPLNWLFNGNQYFAEAVKFTVYQNNDKNIFSFGEHPSDNLNDKFIVDKLNDYKFKIHYMEFVYDEIHLTEEYMTKLNVYLNRGNSIVNTFNTVTYKDSLDFSTQKTSGHEYTIDDINLPSAVLFGFMPYDGADTKDNFGDDVDFYAEGDEANLGLKSNRRKVSEQRTTLPSDLINLTEYFIKYIGDDKQEVKIPDYPIKLFEHSDGKIETFDVYKKFTNYFGDKCPIDYEDWKTNYNFYIVDLTDSVGGQHIDPNLKSGKLKLCFSLQNNITPPPGWELVVLPIYNNIFTQEGNNGKFQIRKRV